MYSVTVSDIKRMKNKHSINIQGGTCNKAQIKILSSKFNRNIKFFYIS